MVRELNSGVSDPPSQGKGQRDPVALFPLSSSLFFESRQGHSRYPVRCRAALTAAARNGINSGDGDDCSLVR